MNSSDTGGGGNAPAEARALGRMVAGSIPAVAAMRFRDREAITCAGTGRRFSFRQVDARANRLANGLAGLGLGKGDCVAFLCNNRAEVVEAYFAIAKLGLVGLPLNYRLAPAEITALMQSMGARAMLFATRFAPVAEGVRAALPQVAHFVAIGDDGPDWAHGYEPLLAAAPAAAPEVEVAEADPFYFNLTSGTTGLPKAYRLSHLNNCAISPMFEGMDTTSQDVMMTVFPAFGRVGYAWIAAGLMFGARNVLTDFAPAEALRLFEAGKVTILNLVPTMAAMLLAEPGLEERDLSRLRGLVFAGAMFPPSLRQKVAERLCPAIYEYYGMQETGALVMTTPEHREIQPDSVGVPLAFADIHIERADGSRAAPGELGEVVGRSPATVTAYFDNPEKSAETFRGGYVHTGDLGFMDEDGFLFIKGRLKDMIITGGQNVHAAEVEDCLLALDGVADATVFGLPDEFWGERVTALVVRGGEGGGGLTEAAVIAHCRQSLAGFKTPKSVLFSDEPLPRTPTGKVQKFLLVERYGDSGG